MMNPRDIIDEVHKLPFAQQKEIYDVLSKEIDHQIGTEAEDDDQRAQKILFTAGLIKEIKPRRTGKIGTFTRVRIEGKPLSETIIEDRR